jgi:phage/plasmid-like protein (TIGR03299 family)
MTLETHRGDGFSVREPMWGFGTALPDYVDRDEAFRLSGQDWRVVKAPLYAQPETDSPAIRPVNGYFAALRSDTLGELGVHPYSYETLDNFEGWDLADAMVDQDAGLRYEAAVTLNGGKRCAVLLRDESFSIAGDDSPTFGLLLVSWAHDGSAAMVATATNVRLKCWNQLTVTLAKGHQRFSFRHTRRVRDRIEQAKAAVTGMRTNTQLYRELAESLTKRQVGGGGVGLFLSRMIPMPEQTGSVEGHRRAVTHVWEERSKLLNLWQESDTIPEGLRYTSYGLFQAGVEYLDWSKRAKSPETRFARTMLGTSTEKDRLLTVVREVSYA